MSAFDLQSAKGNTIIPKEGCLMQITVTFSDSLETVFTKVTRVHRSSDAIFWAEQQDGTWAEISSKYLYIQIAHIPE